MKKLRYSMILGIIFMMLFATNTLGVVETEPNNDLETANVLQPTDNITGTLTKADDADVFKINIKESSMIKIKVTPPVGTDAVILLYRQYTPPIPLIINDKGTGESEEVLTALFPGEVYFEVDYTTKIDAKEEYTVETTRMDALHESEVNDETATANLLPSEGIITGTLLNDFADYYKIEVPSTEQGLNLRLESSADMDAQIDIYDAQKRLVSSIDYGYSGEVEDSYEVLTKGTYYIKISNLNNKGTKLTYDFWFRLEPDFSNVKLTNLQLNTTVFNIKKPVPFQLSVNLSKRAALQLLVKDSKGTKVYTTYVYVEPGKATLSWNGKTKEGKYVTPGQYSLVLIGLGYNGYLEEESILEKSVTVKDITILNKKGTVTANQVKLFATQNTKGKVLKTLAKGTKVTVLELEGNWYKVKLSTGTIGYIVKSYVSIAK